MWKFFVYVFVYLFSCVCRVHTKPIHDTRRFCVYTYTLTALVIIIIIIILLLLQVLDAQTHAQHSSNFLLFLCIVYYVYFTNYFRVCIFVYLLTIIFVRVFSKYRLFVYNNIFHYQLRKNCTYLIYCINLIYEYYIPLFHARAITVYTFVPLYEFAYTCAVYSTFFKCEYRYLIICGPWPKFFNEGERGKTRSWKFC